MAENGARTWLVMLREVSHAIRVAGQRRVMAALALDADTGLAHGYSVAATGQEALAEAFRVGTTRPPMPLLPGRPERILCSATIVGDVKRTLADLFDHGGAPPVEEIVDALEAEDIFDSFLGHMAGRGQPTELATPEDWAMFFEVSRRYAEAEPWTRWSDVNHLDLDLRLRSQETRYLALVLGNEGIQRGLVLYPGETLPAGLSDAVPPSQVNLPLGTLNFYLDPTRKAPPEYVGKALRYGWPGDSKLVPLYMAIAADDPYGISIIEHQGQAHVTLVCARAAQLLMQIPAGAAARALYERRIQATDGVHVVMVADESTTRGKGKVYGLFECHQPLEPPVRLGRTPSRARAAHVRSKGRRRPR